MRNHDDEYILRIIAGTLKGRGLKLKQQKGVRPTKSIIRESLFNSLRTEVIGMAFVEMFAGSGSIGIEALSRGALDIYLIEQDRVALEYLKRNCKALDITSSVRIFENDTFEVLPQILKNNKNILLYCDPPFPIRENMQQMYEKCLSFLDHQMRMGYDVCTIIFEMMSEFVMPDHIGDFTLSRSSKFGKTTLHYYYPIKETQES